MPNSYRKNQRHYKNRNQNQWPPVNRPFESSDSRYFRDEQDQNFSDNYNLGRWSPQTPRNTPSQYSHYDSRLGGSAYTNQADGYSNRERSVNDPLAGSDRYAANKNYPNGQYYGVAPKGYKRSDERIHEEVCEVLSMDSEIDAS